MKQAKKLLALVMVLAMVMSLGITAFAAEGDTNTYTAPETKINFNANDDHVYWIYQIFTGEIAEGKIAKVKYGTAAVLPDGKSVGDDVEETTLTNLSNLVNAPEAQRIEEIKKLFDEDAEHVVRAAAAESTEGLEPGYYVIVDKGTDGTGKGNLSKIVVELGGAITVTPKRSGTPTSEKKVKDINDSETAEYTNWQDSADHDIGDYVPFQIKVTVPGGMENFTNYKMIVHDTQSAGLTFCGQNDSEHPFTVTVKKGQAEEVTYTGDWTLITEGLEGDETFNVKFENMQNAGLSEGDEIYIRYYSELNEGAVIGATGNPNKMQLEYSSRNSVGEETTEKGPEDKVIVFTYKTVVNKVDNTSEPLKGAQFTLYKKVVTDGSELEGHEGFYKTITVTTIDNETTFNFVGLDDGDYVLVETTVPYGYNKAEDIEFTIKAEHQEESDDPQLLKFSGEKTSGNADITDSTVKEDGANPKNEVVNNKGVELPSTGGIGTTIFYVVGSIMMLAAAVLLITRKKMSAYQD